MKKKKVLFLHGLITFGIFLNALTFYLPFQCENRRILKRAYITSCGDFGIYRKQYSGIPPHYHSGIDFKNPGGKPGDVEVIFASAEGKVISILNSNASSNIILKHNIDNNRVLFSTYTHICDIVVLPGDTVNKHTVLGSFIDAPRLDKWGEYLNHLHFEIMKVQPKYIGKRNGYDTYLPYSIDCTDKDTLYKYYYNPILFFIIE